MRVAQTEALFQITRQTSADADLGCLTDLELHDVDNAVGMQVRNRRFVLGLSQEHVAQKMGLTFQQLQKYERGANRISASRLYQLSMILRCRVADFFETVEDRDWTAATAEAPQTKLEAKFFKTLRQMPNRHQTALMRLAETLALAGDPA